MSDYIKREDAVRAVVDAKTGKDKTIDGTRQVTDCLRRIKAIPSADVVEVVRCKDCIYWCKLKEDNGVVVRIHHNELRSQCLNINGLNKTDCITEANDYCSYGERTEA